MVAKKINERRVKPKKKIKKTKIQEVASFLKALFSEQPNWTLELFEFKLKKKKIIDRLERVCFFFSENANSVDCWENQWKSQTKKN